MAFALAAMLLMMVLPTAQAPHRFLSNSFGTATLPGGLVLDAEFVWIPQGLGYEADGFLTLSDPTTGASVQTKLRVRYDWEGPLIEAPCAQTTEDLYVGKPAATDMPELLHLTGWHTNDYCITRYFGVLEGTYLSVIDLRLCVEYGCDRT